MNISETKEKLLELYLKSLKIRTKDYYSHPVRLVQAVKSITGINIENPIEHLLVFCENYIDEFEAEDDMQPSDNIEIPLMVSYKKLEEALLSKDKNKCLKVLSELKRVSEGSQIFEFFIEYSLKYSNESLLVIWSIYRMSLFSNKQFINKEFSMCIDSIVGSSNLLDFKKIDLDTMQNKEKINYTDLYYVLNDVYYSKTVRNEKMRKYLEGFSNYFCEGFNLSEYYSRNILWNHVNNLRYEDLSIYNILKIDSLRGMMKIVEDEKMNPEELYSIIDNYK